MITVAVQNSSNLDEMGICIFQNILPKILKNAFFFVFAIFVQKSVKNAINCAIEGRLKPLRLQEGHFTVIPRLFHIKFPRNCIVSHPAKFHVSSQSFMGIWNITNII